MDDVREVAGVLRDGALVLVPPGRGSVDAGVVDGVDDAGVDFGVELGGAEVVSRGVDDVSLGAGELRDDEGVCVRGVVEDLVDVEAGL